MKPRIPWSVRATLTALLVITITGCGSSGGGSNGGPGDSDPLTGTEGTGPAPGPDLTADTAPEFGTEMNQVVADAIDAVLDQTSGLTARKPGSTSLLKSAPAAVQSGSHPLSPITIPGTRGTLDLDGAYYPAPWPPRYEVTLTFDNYSTDDSLFLNGSVAYNFIVDDTVSPPAVHGLYRGGVAPRGTLGGTIDVHALVKDGQRTAMTLTTNGTKFSLDREDPPSFLSYVTTLAGTNKAGYQNGAGSQARFNKPQGLTVDDEGTIYVADRNNNAIREISPEGTVTTLTENIFEPYDLGINPEDDLVVSSELISSSGGHDPISRIVRKGDLKGFVAPIIESDGLLCTLSNYYYYENCDGRDDIGWLPYARGIDVTDGMTLVAQWALFPSIRAILPDGYIMTLQHAESDCGFLGINDLALGKNGEIYFVNYQPGCYGVLVLGTDGVIRTLAGNLSDFGRTDGVGEAARFFGSEGITFDGVRYLYVADTFNSLIRRVDIETRETVRIAGCLSHEDGFDCTNTFGFRDGWGDDAQFDDPGNVAIDRWGDLYVADTDNHAIRFIRIIADPQRTPTIDRFDPWTMQKGESGQLTIHGTNLALAESVDLGEGISAQIVESGYNQLVLDVTVSENAGKGPRSITVTTAFGTVTTPPTLSLEILETHKKGPTVETISGTGGIPLDFEIAPAELAGYTFPTGLAAIDADRLLVADPLTHTVRLVTTKLGAVEELVRLLTYSLTGSDTDVLGGILTGLGTVGDTLGRLGIPSQWTDTAEDQIRAIAEQAVDEVCQTGGSDCTWMTLPWAGTPLSPGAHNGFRLSASFYLPTDIWDAGSDKYVIADTYNRTVRTVGYAPETGDKADMEVFLTDTLEDHPFSAVLSGDLIYATLPAQGTVARIRSKSPKETLDDWGGIRDQHACAQTTSDAAHPLGVPMGMAHLSGDLLLVADPYCRTIWKITEVDTPVIKDIRGERPAGFDRCADGPILFASFGAPMDVAVDVSGNIYVADAGCHSIRMIKDMAYRGDDLAGELSGFLEGHHSRLSDATYNWIQEGLGAMSSDFVETNKYWVTTIAGGADGKPGFADGPAETSRFNAPTSIALVEDFIEGKKYLFVADTGNQRIRRIIIP